MIKPLTPEMLRVLRIAERDGMVVAGKGSHAGRVERVSGAAMLALIRRGLLSHVYGPEGGVGGRLTAEGRAALADPGAGLNVPSSPKASLDFIDVWMKNLARSAEGLNFQDEDDRATFRGNVYASLRGLKWSGMRDLAQHLGAGDVKHSRDSAFRAIADRYMQQHGWRKTPSQLDADIAEALAEEKS